jgi:hypothetical protein
MRLKLLLCAQGVVRDADSNNVSIFNVLESLHSVGFPLFMQQMDILALLERTPEESSQHDMRFRVAVEETELVSAHLAIDFEDKPRNRAMVHVQGLVVPNPGTLTVTAYLNDVEIGDYSIAVDRLEGPTVNVLQEPEGPGRDA